MRPAVVALYIAFLVGVPAAVADPLFPIPLHLTRQVVDPISGKTTVIEEYGYGNRLVSVNGARTSIADYEKGELTEIDRDAAAYSITKFETIAKLARSSGLAAATGAEQQRGAPNARSVGARTTKSGRSAEVFEIGLGGAEGARALEVAVDRTVTVSREALEVLLGAAYPGVRRAEHDAILEAAAPERTASAGKRGSSGGWALPLEQVTRLEMEGQQIELRNVVVRIGQEPPPPELVTIPPGARLVVSRHAAVSQALEDADRVVPPPLP